MQPLNEAGRFKPRSTNPVDWPHTRCPPQKMSGQVTQTSKPGRPPRSDTAAVGSHTCVRFLSFWVCPVNDSGFYPAYVSRGQCRA
ncbi:hypothetical protein YC2023_086427 [Brassica napus]